MIKLKPCPWCQCEPILNKYRNGYQVECRTLGCRIRPSSYLYNEDERVLAIKSWNTRRKPSKRKVRKL